MKFRKYLGAWHNRVSRVKTVIAPGLIAGEYNFSTLPVTEFPQCNRTFWFDFPKTKIKKPTVKSNGQIALESGHSPRGGASRPHG